MINHKEVFAALRERNSSGETQREIAEKAGISKGYIGDLFSGRNSVEGLTIKKLNQLFPNSKLILDATQHNNITQHSNSGVTVGVNNGTVGADCLSHMIDRIISTDDLTAEEKVKVIKVLKQ